MLKWRVDSSHKCLSSLLKCWHQDSSDAVSGLNLNNIYFVLISAEDFSSKGHFEESFMNLIVAPSDL